MYAARNAKKTPEKPAIILASTGEVLTYGQYEARSNQIAHAYVELGLKQFDRIALIFPNTLEYSTCKGAAERTGLRYVCVNAHLKADEIAYIINDSESAVVIVDESLVNLLQEVRERCPQVRHWLVADSATEHSDFESLAALADPMPTTAIAHERLGTAMLYSSGTTGQPKGILRALNDSHPEDPLPVYVFTDLIFRLAPEMTYLSAAPLYHSAPHSALSGAIRHGATSVVMEKFDAERFLQLVEKYQITTTQVVPTMLSRIMRLPSAVLEQYDRSSLTTVVHGAAPCPPQLKRAVIDVWGPVLYEYYGATEGHGFCRSDSAEWLARPGTVGKAILGEIVILDDDGNECPIGAAGTVWFRGATNFTYNGDPERTAQSQSADGTMSTVDDVGYVDDEGYLFLTDRKSHMIISGGVNIYPQEVEDLLLGHPAVDDAAVIGVPDEDFGEQVKALVVPTADQVAGSNLADELIAYCRARMATFKCPRTIDFVTTLPRTPTGKLQKGLLRKQYRS